LGILISGIAHEINNPNNFISFNMPILRDYLSALLSLTDETAQARPELVFFGMAYPEFREDVFRLLENVRNGSDRINAIVFQLKTFSRQADMDLRREALRQNCEGFMEKPFTLEEIIREIDRVEILK